MRIIGLGYKSRSGKDTVADHLVRSHGYIKVAFADPLKEACEAIFGFSNEQLYGGLKEAVDPFWGFTPRWTLQQLGTEGARRCIGEDVWVRALERRLSKLLATAPGVVVSDVRFLNEARMLRQLGGLLVRVDRPSIHPPVTFWKRLWQQRHMHTSERQMDQFPGWDEVLVNEGTVPELHAKVDQLVHARFRSVRL